MQQTIAIPSPSRADTETVITALETAAVFRSKGDSREAMRWLRRAAESAGEAGDDERALSLSRIIADLHEELEAAAEQEVTPSPPPPPSSRAAPPPTSSPLASYPPPPSTRTARPPSVMPRPSQAPRPSSRPSYNGARPPLSVVPPLETHTATPLAAAVEPARHSPPPPPPPLPEPARVSAPPALPVEHARPSLPATGSRHAARVQVAISTTKAGMLEVRLLADGETARLGSSEAFLVMLDPASTLLAR